MIMAKVKNAFAFRDFDEKKVLQRPFFKNFSLPNASDDEILSSWTLADCKGSLETENELRRYQRLADDVTRLNRLIGRHIKRLRKIFERLYADDKQKTKSERAAELIRNYNWFEEATELCGLKFGKNFSTFDKEIRRQFRIELSSRIKKLRLAKNISQRAMAKRLGIKPPSLAQMESGLIEPSLVVLRRFAVALKVSTDELLGKIETY